MAIEERIEQRVNGLLKQASHLSHGNENGQVLSEAHRQECAGWLTSAVSMIHLLCPSPSNPYRVRSDAVLVRGVHFCAHNQVGEVARILGALLGDAKAGLVSSIADNARAEAFDDFLDHAAAYLRQERKNEAGAIAGVVFEDSMRRICRKHNLTEKNVQLDGLISELAKIAVLTATKAKRARAAAHVRTKATHAQWEEFDLHDVQACIEFAREIVSNELDA